MPHIPHNRLAFALAVVVGLGPFALDAYLPAFTAIARDFGTSTTQVGLTLSLYVIALALGQLVGGPLSDRFGRSRVMFCGLAVFFIGSLIVAVTTSLAGMLLGRLIQAFGGGCSVVGVPAIVRDRTEGNETARLFSLIAMIMFAAPAIAPTLGALLLAVSGWRSIFVFLALYAAAAAFLLRRILFPAGTPVQPPSREPLHRLVTNYVEVVRNRRAMTFIALQALAVSIMMTYLTHAPYLYQEWLGFSTAGFSALFALNVAVMMGFSVSNRRLLKRYAATTLLSAVIAIQATAIAVFAAVVLLDLPKVMAIPALATVIGCTGGIAPNNMAGALHAFRVLAGTAAALMGATQYAVGGVVASLSVTLPYREAVDVVVTMASCSLLALALVQTVRKAVPGPVIEAREASRD